ncbi:hypothetical protein QTP70_026916, partial [Hemibagrus guttatus]
MDISSWMMAHQLKLNPSKTELLIIPGDPSPAQDLVISLNNSMISPSATARNLGVTMDNQLSFSSHVTNVTRSCQFLLYNIRRIRPFLSTQATQVLVQSLVISRLDYCNSLLAGLPLNAIRPLQMIQNAAARLVFNLPKFSHTTPLLRSLHWLPVAARIRFKTLMLAYKAKNGPAPSYLKALFTPRTAPRSLRSTSTARLVPPSLREKATDTLLSSLSSTMDLLCPLSTIRKKNSSTAPWLSDVLRNNRRELRSAARKWKKSKLDTDLISYRTLLSKFSFDVTSAKTSFYKEKLETSAQDPRKLHNIFSSLLNPPAPPSPSSLTAEDFATFYTEKIERICQTFTSLPTSPTSHSQHSATPSLTQLSTVASEEVLQITRSCNPTTCPLDPIPSAMLQTISPDLLPFITTVINGSLTSGHVPTVFKKARVIPILKKPALTGLPLNAIRPLQMIQNAAARLVFNLPKFSHTTPLLRSLHWLPVAARIRFKTLMLAYKAKNGPAPSYLKALFTPRTAPRSLRSTSTARLVPPSLREK